MDFDIERYLRDGKKLVDGKLNEILSSLGDSRTSLEESVRYSALSGGKRLRPILCFAACESLDGDVAKTLPAACAIEMIHTYSLIHDDLPSMDDDTLRRGVPTNHTVYGEATAILAGDALLTDAFTVLVSEGRKAGLGESVICDLTLDISRAAGSGGMIRGQAIDLSLEGRSSIDEIRVAEMHMLKTGSLIEASVVAGARCAGGTTEETDMLRAYAAAVGLAYQIVDDVLDIEGEETGKEKGVDIKKEKSTYPEIVGLRKSKYKAAELTDAALGSIESFDERADALRALAVYLGGRTN